MIRGIGVDLVDVARFEAALSRTPALLERAFTPAERDLPLASLAARFAAKEALAKALGVPAGLSWHEAEVTSGGAPIFVLTGAVAAAVGAGRVHLSLSHDAGLAAAHVLVEDPD
ncbi:holo-[acyl-carrier-protein] synthase [Nocardioides baekrokdamisoli]|uniref:Holo-[acyl-carrier-protein] synthase n=1 Tax=Nocardioides baekrokdamisoli TaxID=1804624 RepID=A0A3G9ID03_9ACTN|nr:holo-ACP synthase [Nocardioides baekrokdamisoli]BBH16837.1 holo-[acyl-carrier-protein] synthase [Nocardioides baekrokdamisoli]